MSNTTISVAAPPTAPRRPRRTASPTTTRPARAVAPLLEATWQISLVLGAALAYFLVRGLTEADLSLAVANAERVLTFERYLGIDVESSLQAHIVGHHWLVTAANWIYIWGHWPAIATLLIWLHGRHREGFLTMRNAMFASGAIGLVIFALFPVAPPRLTDFGFVDTVTEHSNAYRVLQPPSLVNKYAAVPSLHVGWNFLVGVFLWRHSSRRWVRALAICSPASMFAAVVLTANHYIIDGVLGIAVAAAGLAVAARLPAMPREARERRPTSG